jgi:hypothetical protein
MKLLDTMHTKKMKKNKENKKMICNYFSQKRDYRVRLDEDPLVMRIEGIIRSRKKKISNLYTFYIAYDNPKKDFMLSSLGADIQYLSNHRKFFFFGLITEAPQGIYITFYLNKRANAYFRNPFVNIYKYIDYHYNRYLVTKIIIKPKNYIKGLTKEYLIKKTKEYSYYTYRYLYYIAHEIEIIKAIDNSHPILFVQRWFRRIKTFFTLLSSTLDRNPWERNKKYLKIIDFYRADTVREVWYKRWFNTFYYKIDKILMQTTTGAAIEEFKDQFIFFVPSEEENLFETNLRKTVAIFRTDVFTRESLNSLNQLGLDGKFVGSADFNLLKINYKIR